MRILFWNLKDERTRKASPEQDVDAEDKDLPESNNMHENDGAKRRKREANEKRRDALTQAIVKLAHDQENPIDLFLFAEFHLNQKRLLDNLNEGLNNEFRFVFNAVKVPFDTSPAADVRHIGQEAGNLPEADKPVSYKVQMFARSASFQLEEVQPLPVAFDWEGEPFEHPRLTLRRLKLGPMMKKERETELLLAAVHLGSKRDFSPISQREEARRIARRIRYVEQHVVKHRRTVLVGDFNMDPFEEGMTLPDTFHSVLLRPFSRNVRQNERTIQWAKYPCFFNPMWSCWGDGHDRPGGTFVYTPATHDAYGWHMYDQVLLRPEALAYWNQESLQIVTQAADDLRFLTRTKRPARNRLTDHLPIRFQLQDPYWPET